MTRCSVHRALPAVIAGAVVAVVAVVGVLAWGVARDDPVVDGEFVLDEPGVFDAPLSTTASTGAELPDLVLPDGDGQPVALAAFRGTPLVINVWYSTCVPCAIELRDFAEVSVEHGGHLQFIGIDPVDAPEPMLAFAAERGVTYPLLRDPDQSFQRALSITAYPTTLFIDADGRVVHQTGTLTADELRAAISQHL